MIFTCSAKTLSPIVFSIFLVSWLMPANLTIFIVRHAEKPTVGGDLAPEGVSRAQEYVQYFQKQVKYDGKPIQWNFLFASAESVNSDRPFLTLQPLSEAIHIDIDSDFKDTIALLFCAFESITVISAFSRSCWLLIPEVSQTRAAVSSNRWYRDHSAAKVVSAALQSMHYSELSIVSGCPLKGSAALGQRCSIEVLHAS